MQLLSQKIIIFPCCTWYDYNASELMLSINYSCRIHMSTTYIETNILIKTVIVQVLISPQHKLDFHSSLVDFHKLGFPPTEGWKIKNCYSLL